MGCIAAILLWHNIISNTTDKQTNKQKCLGSRQNNIIYSSQKIYIHLTHLGVKHFFFTSHNKIYFIIDELDIYHISFLGSHNTVHKIN